MQYITWLLFCLLTMPAAVQDINVILKEAENFEKQQKDTEALDKYKQVLIMEPTHLKALVKAAELHVALGGRNVDKNAKRLYYETGLSYAQRAWLANSNQADAAYAMALALNGMTDMETENKTMAGYLRDQKRYADSALLLNANHAKANYLLGKWYYDVEMLSGIKKAVVKLIYGKLPDAGMGTAIQYLEKCKNLEPYFVANYLVLAKAYKENHQPAQAIETLTRMVKLPTRTGDDLALKAAGAKLLDALQ